MISKLRLAFPQLVVLNAEKVGYHGNGVIDSIYRLSLLIAMTCGLENTWGKGKIEIYIYAWRTVTVVSKPKRTRKKVKLWHSFGSKGQPCS